MVNALSVLTEIATPTLGRIQYPKYAREKSKKSSAPSKVPLRTIMRPPRDRNLQRKKGKTRCYPLHPFLTTANCGCSLRRPAEQGGLMRPLPDSRMGQSPRAECIRRMRPKSSRERRGRSWHGLWLGCNPVAWCSCHTKTLQEYHKQSLLSRLCNLSTGHPC